MEFSRQESRSGLPFPSPGDLPDPGTEPLSLTLQGDFLPVSHQGSPHGGTSPTELAAHPFQDDRITTNHTHNVPLAK